MGIFSFIGNVASGIQGSRLGKKQMQMGQQMIDEAQDLSSSHLRPEMMTPQAIRMMAEMGRGRMFQNMPGFTNMQNQIDKATASGVTALEKMGTGAEAYGAVADLFGNAMSQKSNLATTNAQFRDRAEMDYMNILEGLGQWQQSAWEWNEADPYLAAQQKAAQLEMMGRQGEWEGLKTKMGSWAESFQGMGDSLDSMFQSVGAAFPGSNMANIAGALGGAA